MAECHPVGFRWVMEAKRRGAKLIHVDPRFTRTSAVSDEFVRIRAGSDIAFLGGLIRYVLEEEKYFREYVLRYTNAANVICDTFRDTEDLDGLFSGYDPVHDKYDVKSWQYEGIADVVPAAGHKEVFAEPGAGEPEHAPAAHREANEPHRSQRDETLQHPRCVFQILRRHFARYTPEMVEQICGVSREQFLRVAETICASSNRERTTALCYAVGWTQHSIGVQYIRAGSILQLLLGNIGRPGGGIMALRGHASIQGSTDIPTLFNLLPGYLPMPHHKHQQDLQKYITSVESPSAWWSETPKYVVSLLKAWWGEHATKDNGYCFEYLPHLTGNHSHMQTVTEMCDGVVKGYFLMGENPAVGSMHGALQRKGLRKLDWLVVRDFALTESSEFWRNAPEIDRGEVRPEEIGTEVFFFPAAAHTEKDGTFTNTQRLLQWHEKAIEPPGDARSDLQFVYDLGIRLKELYARSTDPKDRAIQQLTWRYPTKGPLNEPDAEAVLREINGYRVEDGACVSGYVELEDDGSTACGCWLYSGCFKDGVNQTARRKPASEQSWVAPEWAWAWPSNRRILYNRASADPEGRPWSQRKAYVWWDPDAKRWTGHDVPDFIADRPPDYRPPRDATGLATIAGDTPFIMQSDSRAWLFAPTGLVDGPLPTHYEPEESVVENALYRQQCNPVRLEWKRRDNPYHQAFADPRFPYVITTFRLTEHHTAGAMSRWLSWLSELQPEFACEVSPELAREAGLDHRGWATIVTARAEIECRVLVTERMKPQRINGRFVHTIGLPYHWGRVGRVRGDAANELIGFVGDPNVSIQESKAATANIFAGRIGRERRAPTSGPVTLPIGDPGTPFDGGPARDLPGVGQKTPTPPEVMR